MLISSLNASVRIFILMCTMAYVFKKYFSCTYVQFLPRDAKQSAVLIRQVLCLSVCLSVTLRYRDHIGWYSSKIIWWLASLGCSLSAARRPQHHGSTPRETPWNFGRNRGAYGKMWHLACKSSDISETRQDMDQGYYWGPCRKSHTRFRLVPKSTSSLPRLSSAEFLESTVKLQIFT